MRRARCVPLRANHRCLHLLLFLHCTCTCRRYSRNPTVGGGDIPTRTTVLQVLQMFGTVQVHRQCPTAHACQVANQNAPSPREGAICELSALCSSSASALHRLLPLLRRLHLGWEGMTGLAVEAECQATIPPLLRQRRQRHVASDARLVSYKELSELHERTTHQAMPGLLCEYEAPRCRCRLGPGRRVDLVA